MAYRLKPNEAVPDGIRRIVLEEIESASQGLASSAESDARDEAVHEARKSVKKIRGILRLVGPQIGPVYRKENRRLRDIGRQLSELRDAAAILEIFDGIARQEASGVDAATLAAVRRGLELDKEETEQKLDAERVVARARRALMATGKRVPEWPLKKDGWEGLAPGLQETYRRGRRALKKAQSNGSPERLHDLRKRAKDHWYHVRLLENIWTELMQAHENSLRNLETWLGDDHNIVVLEEKVAANPERYGDPDNLQAFVNAAKQHQEKLRADALALAVRLYAEKPGAFTRSLAKLWDVWQDSQQPKKTAAKPPRQSPARQVRQPAATRKAGSAA
jgi:CHAD domain-containing protein